MKIILVILRFIFEKVFAPIVVAVLSPPAIAISSKLQTGEWLNYFRRIPLKVWVIFIAGLVIWYLAIRIRLRIKYTKSVDLPMIAVASYREYEEYKNFEYQGVIWVIRIPKKQFHLAPPLTSEFEIKPTPECPKCRTELEEKKRFWKGYLWMCVGCKFTCKSKDTFFIENERALRIFKGRYKTEIEKNQLLS